ncbi:hypothetical protein ABH926_002191 [Catenulispora sp. GP43]|uniref:thaumatin family protein n=1 Tax=Catenulispora sp. GP43 TaxID=3156263 RepID=UPI00351624BA
MVTTSQTGASTATAPLATVPKSGTTALPGTGTTAPPGTATTAPSGTGPATGPRTLTMVNKLSQTIWPAVAADPKHPVAATGWVLAPGASVTISIPDHWDVRVWARAGCAFNSAGTGHCLSGDCQGKFQCGSTWGEFPSTLAEFNLNAWQGMDFYDVSLVEGNNLPMYVNQSGGRTPDPMSPDGCTKAGCTRDASATCPSVLQVVRGGAVTACKSSCLALGGDQMCCLGQWSSRAACDPAKWPVDSAAVFKKAEPFAYSYVDDDATSVLTCTGECSYRITWGVSP